MARLFVADDKFPDVIAQLEARGWTRFPHDTFPNYHLRWTNYAKLAWSRVRAHQIVNHFHGAIVLSRKNDLAMRLYRSNIHGNVDAFFPRTLDLTNRRDQDKLVTWFLYARAVGVVRAVFDGTGDLPTDEEIHAAMRYLERIVQIDGLFARWSTETLDLQSLEIYSEQWTPLRQRCTSKENTTTSTSNHQQLTVLLDQLRMLDPQLDGIAAGHGDVWICKPSNLSQGRGIHLLTDLDALLRLVPETTTQTAWIVQKYIERPLLLQNGGIHKFDVRQWVLLTSLDPLTVYWYKDCYLRFCSHPFTLENTTLDDRFTHLSNYSVQRDALTEVDPSIDAMWGSKRYQDLLRHQYERDVWSETILPQMQHATLRAIKACLPDLRAIGVGFEWLGIDFLIDADFHVWLLEVNVSPDVSHSTDVTASIIPNATRGVLDLVLGEESSSKSNENGWVKMNLS